GIGAAYGLAAAATSEDQDSSIKKAIDPPVADLAGSILNEDQVGTTFISAAGSGGSTDLGGAINVLFGYNSANAFIAKQSHVNQRAAQLWSDPGALANEDVRGNAAE